MEELHADTMDDTTNLIFHDRVIQHNADMLCIIVQNTNMTGLGCIALSVFLVILFQNLPSTELVMP